jgi:hypothetical protein
LHRGRGGVGERNARCGHLYLGRTLGWSRFFKGDRRHMAHALIFEAIRHINDPV